jgi:DNA-binding response OmpR family regulator
MTNTTRGMAAAQAQGAPEAAARALRIVIAEDDRDAALTLMMILRDEGHEATAVHSGRNVMGAVLDHDPDVVILDIHMPGLSGWEVARTIRARKTAKQPMLIGISGEYKQGADKILSVIIGFDYYLLKPYDPAVVLALIAPLRSPQPPA